MQWIIVALTIFYLLNAAYYFRGLRALSRQRIHATAPAGDTLPMVSIIVPARNEETTLGKTLRQLLAQHYPPERYEIIVVNDRSTDRTAEIIAEFARQTAQVLPIEIDSIDPGKSPKKQAISAGIRASRGALIMTTDADVERSEDWLPSLVSAFEPSTGLVAGMTLFRPGNGWLSTFQALDSASLAAVSAALIARGHPLTCQASNLAYRAQAFRDVDGFAGVDHITSGDDDLLMQKIDLFTDWNIKVLTVPESLAYTEPVSTLKDLMNQRARWASKGAHYPKRWMRFYLLLLYLSLLGFVLSIFFLPIRLLIPVWLAKLATDSLMTRHIVSLFRERSLWRGWLPVALLQPLLVTVAGLLGSLGKFSWK